MQGRERRRGARCRRRRKKLGEGAAGSVETLEQRALTGKSGRQIGGEGGAPLLKGCSGAAEVGFTGRESRRRRTMWFRRCTDVRAIRATGKVRC